MSRSERAAGHPIGFLQKAKGYASFYLRDKAIYEDPELYDAVVNGWLGRETLAGGTADVVARSAASINANRVLELGAGTGVLTLQLARRGFHVTATDVGQKALDALACKAHTQQVGEQITTEQLNFNNQVWPMEDNSYPVIATLRANRYIENLGDFFSSVRRILEPNGRFIFPAFLIDLVPWKQHSQLGIRQPTHPINVRRTLLNAGFDVDEQASGRYSQVVKPEHTHVPFFYKPRFLVASKPS